jgi:hypothetical protein
MVISALPGAAPKRLRGAKVEAAAVKQAATVTGRPLELGKGHQASWLMTRIQGWPWLLRECGTRLKMQSVDFTAKQTVLISQPRRISTGGGGSGRGSEGLLQTSKARCRPANGCLPRGAVLTFAELDEIHFVPQEGSQDDVAEMKDGCKAGWRERWRSTWKNAS